MNIYVTEQGASVRKDGGRISVEKSKEGIFACPAKDVESLVVFGGVQITTQALLSLLDQGSDIAFMTADGHFRGSVRPARDKNALLRMRQFEHSKDEVFCLKISQKLVQAKIFNAISVLKMYLYNSNNPVEPANIKRLEDMSEKALKALNPDELRGYEGNAAKWYFEDFSSCFVEPGRFKGRKFYPAPDPVNALLSFGYSFIAREMQSALESVGLDPYIGFFHKLQYGRASLSLDLIEPLRHIVVDRLVLKLFNKGMIGDEDFEKGSDSGCYLKRDSLNKFIRAYEEHADAENVSYGEKPDFSFRRILRTQASELKSSLENETEYKPYIFTRKCAVQSVTT